MHQFDDTTTLMAIIGLGVCALVGIGVALMLPLHPRVNLITRACATVYVILATVIFVRIVLK